MNFKLRTLSFGVLSVIGLTSCFAKKSTTENTPDFGFFKNEDAKEACLSTNLSKWELTGPFVHNFLRCASDKSRDGSDSLPGLQSLLNKFDADKMQRVLDFVLTVDPNGTTHEERYPYLLALTTVLDRGLIENPASGLNLTTTERLSSLQDFLLTFDANRTREIISTWSRSGHLAEVLNELGIFVDSLEDYTIEVYAHEMLSGKVLRPEALAISRRVLSEEELFRSFENTVAAKPSRILNASEQSQLLAPYRESLAPSDQTKLVSLAPESQTITTPMRVLAEEHKSFTAKELTGLKDFLLSFWKSYQGISDEERQSIDSRIARSVDTLLNIQSEPVKWVLAMLRDTRDLKASDLDRVTFALDQLLLEGNNLSLEAIRAKAGSSRLMNELAILLTQGGKIPACSSFDSAPFAEESKDFADFQAKLDRLTKPSSSCSNRVPLIVAIEHLTGVTLTENANSELWDGSAASPELLRKFVLASVASLKQESSSDPYRAYNLQLATDRLTPEIWLKLETKLNASKDWTSQGLAELDEAINAEFKGVLESDFLEKLISQRIERLGAASYQFEALSGDGSDQTLEARASRVFAGLYSGGPLEQVLASKRSLELFTFSEDEQDLKNFFATHPSVWSRILFKAREAEGIFRSPAMGSLAGESSNYFSGAGSSLRNYIGFTATDAKLKANINAAASNRLLQPYQAILPFSEDEQGKSSWALWYQHFANGPMVSKDVPRELSKKLENWMLSSLIPTLSNPEFWPELAATAQHQSQSLLSPEYFDIEAYTPSEARMLATYYFKQFQKPAPKSFPEGVVLGKSSTPKNDLAAFADPMSGFFNSSYLVKDDYESQYTAYLKSYPNSLKNGSTLSAIKASVMPDYAGFTAQESRWNFAEQVQINDITRLPVDADSPMALLSTLDLLTFAKPQAKFIPQPLVGFAGKLCRTKVKDAATPTVWVDTLQACPADFQGATPEEAYEKFRDYLSQAAVQSFCPYLDSDEFGPRFVWAQRLGLSLDDPGLCQPQNKSLLEDYRFPVWHSARVLNDIFAMGKKAKIKSGLVSVPSAIRYYKIKAKGLTPAREALEFFSLAKGIQSSRQAADQVRRQFFAGSFWVGSPNFLNSYLNFVSQTVDIYAWRAGLIALAERNSAGEQKDTLRDIIRAFSSQQKESKANDETLIQFGVRVFDRIFTQEEYRNFAANFLANLNSSEAYDFYSNELPLALVQLFPIDQNPFEWEDKGLSLSKNLAQHATLRSWQVVSEGFSPSELSRFLRQAAEAIQVLPDPVERSTFLARTIDEVLKLGTLYQTEAKTHLSESLEALVQNWARLDFGRTIQRNWTAFVTKITLPLSGLDGQEKISGQAALESILAAALTKGPNLLLKMQEASQVEGSPLQTEPLFWRNWLNNVATTVDTQDEGSFAMASFLSEPRFGISLDHGALWLPLLRQGEVQTKALDAIAAMDSVATPYWQKALTEMTDLSGRLTRAFGFLRKNLVWNIDPDHNAYRIALDKVYELSRDKDLRDKQIELLSLWLGENEEVKASEESTGHGFVQDQ